MIKETFKKNFQLLNLLFSLYIKRSIKGIRFYICGLLVFIPCIFSYFLLIDMLTWGIPISQSLFDFNIFWNGFIFQWIQFGMLIPIILACCLISQDFSKKTAPIIYASIPRSKYLSFNIFFLIIHLIILEIISFISFGILSLIIMNKIVSVNLLFIGFFYILFYLLLYLSFTFILSSLTKNSIIALFIPIVYINLEGLLINFDLELLSFRYYSYNISRLITSFISLYEPIIFSGEILFSILVLILLPLALLIISIFGFKFIDIRLD
jgi:ABC-type transport system involved in multi-copper enzyme maturation permease subunit